MKSRVPRANGVSVPFLAILAAAICIFQSGCSSSPSTGDGQRAIQDQVAQQSQGRITLISFDKSNGAEGEANGFKIYLMEFDAEIKFIEECKWVIGPTGQQLSFNTAKPVKESRDWDSLLNSMTKPGVIVGKDQIVKLSGVIRFVKKEKGWSPNSIELTKIDSALGSQSPNPPPGGAETKRQLGQAQAVKSANDGADFGSRAPELQILDQYLGEWNDPRGFRTSYEWIVGDGKFLQQSLYQTNIAVIVSLALMNYDKNNHRYRAWWFYGSSDSPELSEGIWDSAAKTMTWTSPAAGNRPSSVTKQSFPEDGRQDISYRIPAADGKVGDEIRVTKTRVRASAQGDEPTSTGQSPTDIQRVLKSIEGAKEQWALENRKVVGDTPTEEDLKNYFPRNKFPQHPIFDFVINPVGTPARISK